MNPSIEEEISEHPFDLADQAAEFGISSQWGGVSKRGPAKIPELWTRVISLSYDDLNNIRPIAIDIDIDIVKNIENNDYGRDHEEIKRA